MSTGLIVLCGESRCPTCLTRTRTSEMLSFGVPSVPLGGLHSASDIALLTAPQRHMHCCSTTLHACHAMAGDICQQKNGTGTAGSSKQISSLRILCRCNVYIREQVFEGKAAPEESWSPPMTWARADSHVRPSKAPRPLQTHRRADVTTLHREQLPTVQTHPKTAKKVTHHEGGSCIRQPRIR